jgi:hypothetical protein
LGSGLVKGLNDAERGILGKQFAAVVLLHPQFSALMPEEMARVVHRLEGYPAPFAQAVDGLERGVQLE